jgi:type I restriction enzyme S subunit
MTFVDEILLRTGWRRGLLGQLFDIQQGKALSAATRPNGPVRPFLRTRNITWGSVDLRDLDTMPFSDAETARLRLRKEDLLCCEGGDIGRTAIWKGESDDCLYQNHVHRLRARSDQVNPHFVRFWLEAAFCTFGVYEGAGNRTTIPNLSAARLKQLELPIPPLEEQNRIVEILERVELAAKEQETERELLVELFEAVQSRTLRQGRFGVELHETEIGPLPVGWRVARIGEVASLLSGGTPPKSDSGLWSGTLPWVSPKDMKRLRIDDAEDHISEEAVAYTRLVPAGAVLLVIRGMILAKEIPVAITEVPVAFNQDMKAIVASDHIHPRFLLFAILSRRDALAREIGTSAHGTRRLGTSAVEELLIPLPPFDEQVEIATGLDAVVSLEVAAGHGAVQLREMYNALLAELLSGTTRTVLPESERTAV